MIRSCGGDGRRREHGPRKPLPCNTATSAAHFVHAPTRDGGASAARLRGAPRARENCNGLRRPGVSACKEHLTHDEFGYSDPARTSKPRAFSRSWANPNITLGGNWGTKVDDTSGTVFVAWSAHHGVCEVPLCPCARMGAGSARSRRSLRRGAEAACAARRVLRRGIQVDEQGVQGLRCLDRRGRGTRLLEVPPADEGEAPERRGRGQLRVRPHQHPVELAVERALQDAALRLLAHLHEVAQLRARVRAADEAARALPDKLVDAAARGALAVAPLVVSPDHLEDALAELLARHVQIVAQSPQGAEVEAAKAVEQAHQGLVGHVAGLAQMAHLQ
mmetsp:Transcript_88934/g.174014  ORF Transcript_88934/g.174014 Transcript_88934/m.174014 type:complete len:333 (-) Transcript_88934:417-1415(-)